VAKSTILSSGPINGGDTLTVELIQPDRMLVAVRIVWPSAATIITPETMCKDDWPMRPGDHGRTVIMAGPPTAHAMFRHSPTARPVDVKSLGDAIHFAAHRCARAESIRGDCAVTASDWTRAPRPNAWTLMPRSTRRPSPRTGGPTSTRSRAVTRQVRGPMEHRPGTRQEIVPAARKRRSRGRVIAVGSLGFGPKLWRASASRRMAALATSR